MEGEVRIGSDKSCTKRRRTVCEPVKALSEGGIQGSHPEYSEEKTLFYVGERATAVRSSQSCPPGAPAAKTTKTEGTA
jgi:hypothetical protein